MNRQILVVSAFIATITNLWATKPIVHGHRLELCGRTIGYIDRPDFDQQHVAPALQAWLEAAEVQGTALPTGQRFTPVEPLLGQTAWNQEWPFNLQCPLYDGQHRSATGCVATAMAQVMYYHQWPVQGQGEHTYRCNELGYLTVNFATTRYDWADMQPRYDDLSTASSQEAVAQLMWHCGVAVSMVYGESSGANDTDVPPALTEYFGYSPDIHYRQRRHYTLTEWLTLINEELQAGRPVLAYGMSRSGAHAYVFDGMDQDGMIHINWGWGGMSNGYFAPIDLTPSAQGTGGSASGYNMEQRIVTGIEPMRDSTQIRYLDLELIAMGALSAQNDLKQTDQPVTLQLDGTLTNGGWRDADIVLGLELSDGTGTHLRTIDTNVGRSLRRGEGWRDVMLTGVQLGPLAEGHYTLRLVGRDARSAQAWLPVRHDIAEGASDLALDVAADGSVTFSLQQSRPAWLTARFTVLPDTLYRKVPMRLGAMIRNEGEQEYHAVVHLEAYDQKGTRVMLGTDELIDVEPADSTELTMTYTFTLIPGSYTLCLFDQGHRPICEPVTVSVQLAQTIVNPTSVVPMRVSLLPDGTWQSQAVLTAGSGYAGGLLYTYIYNKEGETRLGCLTPSYYFLKPDDVTTVTMTGTMDNLVPGMTYRLQLVTYDGTRRNRLDDAGSIVLYDFVPEGESIASVIEQPEASDPVLYDLMGRRRSASACTGHGLYITVGRK